MKAPRWVIALAAVLVGGQALAQGDQVVHQMISELTEQVRRDPNDFEAWASLGAWYGKLRKYDEAIACFKRAIAANPKHAEAYLGLASTYGFQGRTEEKFAACKQAIALRPDYADAYAYLGSGYAKAGRTPEAIETFKTALGLRPGDANVLFALGAAYLFSGNEAAAREQLRLLDKASPERAREFRGLMRELARAEQSGEGHHSATVNASSSRRTSALALVVTGVVFPLVGFFVSRILGWFILLLVVGGCGRWQFRRNAYFYTRIGAVINGVLWGAILGGGYWFALRTLHVGLGWSIGLLVWGLLATAYSGYEERPVPDWKFNGSHVNLLLIQVVSSTLYLIVALIALLARPR